MLAAIERKLTAIVGDGVAARAHLSVLEGPMGAPQLDPGKGAIVVSLFDIATDDQFEKAYFGAASTGPAPTSRRVLPVRFRARLEFAQRPADGVASALSDARALQLDDVALAVHLLADPEIRNGKQFAVAAADPGFRILDFDVDKASITPALAGVNLTASIECKGSAEIWPPGKTTPEGPILAVDAIAAPLPVRIDVDDRVVPGGGSTKVRLRSIGGKRLLDPKTNATEPLRLAVLVASDLPPAQRGKIPAGVPGVETGVSIVAAGGDETVVPYQAPGGNLGSTRVEYVAFHLATPDNRKGVFLGSAAVNLVPAP